MTFTERGIGDAPTIIGTGLIALDVVIHCESPANMHLLAGGTCGNVLAIMSYLGWASYPVARLNGDAASKQVRNDLSRWGVQLDFADLAPSGNTPIIVQKIRKKATGGSSHTFSWNCPSCGANLPRYKPVLASTAKCISQEIKHPNVFFTDRISPASLILAKACAEKGALIVLEPSAIVDAALFEEMVSVAHILKYSTDRLGNLSNMDTSMSPHLQIETCGAEGLRFRLGKGSKEWYQVSSFQVDSVRDTCGAGDWMTAGLIYSLGVHGSKGLLEASSEKIVNAIEFGQAMAGWNCQFIGARGGMYEHDTASMRRFIAQIMDGSSDAGFISEPKIPSTSSMAGICPNCHAMPSSTDSSLDFVAC